MENRLEHLDEFQDILSDYEVSDESQHILDETKLVLLLAPSSSGRNALIKGLLETDEYYFIVSDTTRHPRTNDGLMEQNGVEYWFRSEDDFLKDLQQGKYLEAEVIHKQQVSGISIRELQKARDRQKTAITDVDLLGVHNVRAAKPDTICLLILPPSFDEWQRRFDNRGKLSNEEKRRRFETATRILQAGLDNDYFTIVVNDDYDRALAEIHDIVKSGVDKMTQMAGKVVVKELLKATTDWLEAA